MSDNTRLEIIKTNKGYIYEIYAGTYEIAGDYKSATIYYDLSHQTKQNINLLLKNQGYNKIKYVEVDIVKK